MGAIFFFISYMVLSIHSSQQHSIERLNKMSSQIESADAEFNSPYQACIAVCNAAARNDVSEAVRLLNDPVVYGQIQKHLLRQSPPCSVNVQYVLDMLHGALDDKHNVLEEHPIALSNARMAWFRLTCITKERRALQSVAWVCRADGSFSRIARATLFYLTPASLMR